MFGNVGSGKSASMVRYMRNNPQKKFITNINVHGKGFKNVMKLKAEMIIKREPTGVKRNGQETFKLKLNIDFWRDLVKKEGEINIIIDEAHIFLNPRRSQSSLNLCMTDWLALLRRIVGSNDNNGDLILITQLSRRLDIIAKEMATNVKFCIHHYVTRCSNCQLQWEETNETPNKFKVCPRCNSFRINKVKSIIEIFEFKNVDAFMQYKEMGIKSYYKRYLIKDIETIFGNYDTLQFEDMLSNY